MKSWFAARTRRGLPRNATVGSYQVHEQLPHLTNKKFVVFPALGKLVEHSFTLFRLDSRQHGSLQLLLVHRPVFLVEIVGTVVWCLLRTHSVARPEKMPWRGQIFGLQRAGRRWGAQNTLARRARKLACRPSAPANDPGRGGCDGGTRVEFRVENQGERLVKVILHDLRELVDALLHLLPARLQLDDVHRHAAHLAGARLPYAAASAPANRRPRRNFHWWTLSSAAARQAKPAPAPALCGEEAGELAWRASQTGVASPACLRKQQAGRHRSHWQGAWCAEHSRSSRRTVSQALLALVTEKDREEVDRSTRHLISGG